MRWKCRSVLNTLKIQRLLESAISDMTALDMKYTSYYWEARADVAQLLTLADKERALLWTERVIMKQNYLFVLFMIRGCCNVLIQRIGLLTSTRQLPGEMKEVVASLLYATPRCAELPQLQDVAKAFVKHFGKALAASIAERPSTCGVNQTLLHKLSLEPPSLENRLMMIQKIGEEIGLDIKIIKCQGQACSFEIVEAPSNEKQEHFDGSRGTSGLGTMKHQKSYIDIATAAKCASEAAANASRAARIAVQLMKTKSTDYSEDYPSNSETQGTLSDPYHQSSSSEECHA